MAYSTLRAAIQAAIKQNDNEEITGNLLQSVLLSIVNTVGAGYNFAGVATPSTNPGTPDGAMFWIGGKGTYANFGSSVTIAAGYLGIFMWDGSAFTRSVLKLSGGEGVFDVTDYTGNEYANLSAALAAIPQAAKAGGMEIRFVQSSDHKYVQYRFMLSGAWTLVQFSNPENWQGVDDTPLLGSDNLVKSSGVADAIQDKQEEGYLINVTTMAASLSEDNKYASISGLQVGLYTVPNSTCRKYDIDSIDSQHKIHIKTKRLNSNTYTMVVVWATSGNTAVGEQLITTNINIDVVLSIPSNAAYLYVNSDIGATCVVEDFEYYNIRNKIDECLKVIANQGLTSAQKKNALANLGLGDGEIDALPVIDSNRVMNSGGIFNSLATISKVVSEDFIKGKFWFYNQQTGMTLYNDNKFACCHLVVNGENLKEGDTIVFCCKGASDTTYPTIYTTNADGNVVRSSTFSDYAIHSIIVGSNETDIYINAFIQGITDKPIYVLFDGTIRQRFANLQAIADAAYKKASGKVEETLERTAGYATTNLNNVAIYGTGTVANSAYALVDVTDLQGKKLFITTTPVSSTFNLLYIFATSGNTVIDTYQSTSPITDYEVTVPSNATKLYINGLDSKNIVLGYIVDINADLQQEIIRAKAAEAALEDSVESIGNSIDSITGGYDFSENPIVLPSHIYLRSDKEIPLYKTSLFTKYLRVTNCDVLIRSVISGKRVFASIGEPSYFGINDLGTTAKAIIQRQNVLNKLLYKDLVVMKKDVTSLNGANVKVLSYGDSLTEGLEWGNTPVCMLADELAEIGVTTSFIGTLARNFTNKQGQTVKINYEGHGGWTYEAAVGMKANYVQVPDSYTKSEWVEGVDGTMADIKKNNPFLYEAEQSDLENYPQWCFHVEPSNPYNWKSYTENPNLETYWIFNPTKYFSEREIDIPDIITIAFGTNDWYLNEGRDFNIARATNCCKWMVQRFAAACPNAKIIVIPLNNFPTSLNSKWEQYAMPLCSNVIKEIEGLNNNNVFICPIYAQGSRVLGFNGTSGSASNVSDINNIQQISIDSNVHMLYVDDDSNDDYAESLAACVINLI